MCGISGVMYFDGRSADPQLLEAMSSRLAHRGPDDLGVWACGPVGFGHRRLSIIDLGHSHQPMTSADERMHLCFNGEIFNYRHLRESLDYPFRTDGDTEVLLAALATRGTDALADLEGQFAFALSDLGDGSLLLARDRVGVLPLYYYADSRMIAFASEIKALLPALDHQPGVDRSALAAYLGSRSTPAPMTLLEGVRKLMPGHYLRVSAEGRLLEQRYWSIPSPDEVLDVTEQQATRLLEESLQDSVRSALVADVPVGAYLSGGLDSSLIVAMMSKLHGSSVQTFSAGFTDSADDELPFARRVSSLLGTQHHEVIVGPQDFQDLWQKLTWHRDAPISEPADVAVFRLAELARRDVKVVLSGEGSDELFGGYPKYRAARSIQLASVMPGALREHTSRLVDSMLPARAGRLRPPLRAAGARSESERFRAWFAPFSTEEVGRLLGERLETPYPPALEAEGDLLRRMLYVDCHGWLSDNLLERGDRMSMAASLELRPPFLSRQVVELAFRLPSGLKVRRGETKWLVKQVARNYLPSEIVDRRKVGFRVPLDRWFRGELQPMARDMLCSSSSFVGEALDRDFVSRLLDRHASGRADEAIRIWTLLCLEVWHQTQFDGSHLVKETA